MPHEILPVMDPFYTFPSSLSLVVFNLLSYHRITRLSFTLFRFSRDQSSISRVLLPRSASWISSSGRIGQWRHLRSASYRWWLKSYLWWVESHTWRELERPPLLPYTSHPSLSHYGANKSGATNKLSLQILNFEDNTYVLIKALCCCTNWWLENRDTEDKKDN